MRNPTRTTVLVRVGLGRLVCRKFEQDLNALLTQGWNLSPVGVQFERIGWFRFMLVARLTNSKPVSHL